jgi:hypothetical protein
MIQAKDDEQYQVPKRCSPRQPPHFSHETQHTLNKDPVGNLGKPEISWMGDSDPKQNPGKSHGTPFLCRPPSRFPLSGIVPVARLYNGVTVRVSETCRNYQVGSSTYTINKLYAESMLPPLLSLPYLTDSNESLCQACTVGTVSGQSGG